MVIFYQKQGLPMDLHTYLRLDETSDEQYEYFDGYAYTLPSSTIGRACIDGNMYSELARIFRSEKACSPHGSSIKIQVNETRFFYPGASVTCDNSLDQDATFILAPSLIVEADILQTRFVSVKERLDYYQAISGLRTLIHVHGDQRKVERIPS